MEDLQCQFRLSLLVDGQVPPNANKNLTADGREPQALKQREPHEHLNGRVTVRLPELVQTDRGTEGVTEFPKDIDTKYNDTKAIIRGKLRKTVHNFFQHICQALVAGGIWAVSVDAAGDVVVGAEPGRQTIHNRGGLF